MSLWFFFTLETLKNVKIHFLKFHKEMREWQSSEDLLDQERRQKSRKSNLALGVCPARITEKTLETEKYVWQPQESREE